MPADLIMKAIHSLTEAVNGLPIEQAQERNDILQMIQQLRRLYGNMMRSNST